MRKSTAGFVCMSFRDRFQHKLHAVNPPHLQTDFVGSNVIRTGPPNTRLYPTKLIRKTCNTQHIVQASHVGNQTQRSPLRSTDAKALHRPGTKQVIEHQPSIQNQPDESEMHIPGQLVDEEKLESDVQPEKYKTHLQVYPSRADRILKSRDGNSVKNPTKEPKRLQQVQSPSKSDNNRKKSSASSRPSSGVHEKTQDPENMLAYSKRARPVQYEPCKLSQYRKEKSEGYYELGKLQPDLNSEELQQKRAQADKMKSFAKSLQVANRKKAFKKKATGTGNRTLSAAEPLDARSRALAFAKHIPKPRLVKQSVVKDLEEELLKTSMNGEKAEEEPVIELDKHMDETKDFQNATKDLDDLEEEEDEICAELEQLQLLHEASKARVYAFTSQKH